MEFQNTKEILQRMPCRVSTEGLFSKFMSFHVAAECCVRRRFAILKNTGEKHYEVSLIELLQIKVHSNFL